MKGRPSKGIAHLRLGNEPTTLCDVLVGMKDGVVSLQPYRFILKTLDSTLTVFGRSFTTCYNIDFHNMRQYREAKKIIQGSSPFPLPNDYGFRCDYD